jgi:hypothetical protein
VQALEPLLHNVVHLAHRHAAAADPFRVLPVSERAHLEKRQPRRTDGDERRHTDHVGTTKWSDVINAPDPRRWRALALLCGAFFMVVLDATIVRVALPSIQADLGFSEQGLQWVLSAYALTYGGLLLLGGRAADLLGRRRLFTNSQVL